MTFVGREAELHFLDQYYAKEGSQILVVYGQKGVGKTTLLQMFCEEKECFYYMARACSDREQRCQWARELRASGAQIGDFPEYEEIFSALSDSSSEEKIVLVVDEFHHMVKGDTFFFAKLSRFIAGNSLNVLVVLASSASGWVENHMVGKIGSDAASISGFLKVRELDFQTMLEIFPAYREDDGVQIYAMLGGVPGLWNKLDTKRTISENLIHNVLNKCCGLYWDMASYLSEELREPAVYNTILSVIASGNNKLNDIYHHTGFSRAKISVYLKNLMEIDLVEKVGAGTYWISKPHIRFYFRFLFPNQSLLEELSPDIFFKEIVEDAFPGFVREAYRKNRIYE